MDMRGKVVIVTGAAGGIGGALVRRFHRAGTAGVAALDLDEAGAVALAGELGDGVIGLRCDVSKEADVVATIETTEARFGPVDVYCANAGIGGGTDLETPIDDWHKAVDVNVMAHVFAARRLVPGWVERGSGYFVATASAAGLLTQIGSAPYAVTKHGAVAFAEWLAVTYGDQGVGVSCLCPMGVNTNMLNAGTSSDGTFETGAAVVRAAGDVLEPETVADVVLEAIEAGRFLILPHPEVLTFFQRKASDYDRWLSGMRRLKARVGAQ
jgi:NAD(P)-dependent dehydrogenase (short-subunit alcohol dehydrogenase family)